MDAAFTAILFVDVYDSVGLFDALGDARAHKLIADCHGDLMAIIRQYEGQVIGTQGDSILAAFPSADAAFDAATEMQGRSWQPPVLLKAGFQFGPVIEDAGDVFGNTVNTAARLVGLARPQEILTTEETVGVLSGPRSAQTRFLVAAQMKGKSRATRIHAVHTGHDTQMTVATADLAAERRARQPNCLLLMIGREREYVITRSSRRVFLGRDEGCDVVVQEQVVSRRHAMIEARGGEFYLTDCSTNGTFVQGRGDDVIQLRRDSIVLSRTGLIALGRWPSQQQPQVIRYARMHEQPEIPLASRA